MSKQETTMIVLELTRDEALGLVQLLGGTTGTVGYEVYDELLKVLGSQLFNGRIAARNEALCMFPDLKGTGVF